MTQVIGRILFALICIGLGIAGLLYGGPIWIGVTLVGAGIVTLVVGIKWW